MKKLSSKLFALVLMLIMMITSIQPAFAYTMAESTGYVPNPIELELGVTVEAKKSGDAGYTNALLITSNVAEIVNYKTTLDMTKVREYFSKPFISNVIPYTLDAELKAEFDAGVVTTVVEVIIDFPEAAIITGDISDENFGQLDAGEIFNESKRTLNGNKLTITYVNDESLTAGELVENNEEYLKDITFTIDGAVQYSRAGSHKVSVTMSGYTEIEFASKTQAVKYYGASSQITTYTEAVVEHVLEFVALVPPTCTELGWTEGARCVTHLDNDGGYGCGAHGIVRPESVPAREHKHVNGDDARVHIDGIAPTCSHEGANEHFTCILCKQDFNMGYHEIEHSDVVIPKNDDHQNIITINGVAATCTTDGKTDGKKCNDCGKVTEPQERIPVLGHSESTVAGSAADCTTDGKTNGKKCLRCGITLESQKIIPATGHNFGNWEVTTPATENTTGLKTRTCQNGCGTTESQVIPKLAHTHSVKYTEITQKPTCTEPGLEQGYCGCGEPVGEPITVPATGHNKVSKVEAVKATCQTTGIIEHYACADCNGTFRDAACKKTVKSVVESKDKHNHAGYEQVLPRVAPTCTDKGLEEGLKCSACNVIIKKQKVLPQDKTKHEIHKVFAVAPTCTTTGVEEHDHCEICNADFDANGKIVDKSKFIVAATGHKWEGAVWHEVTAATADAKGLQERSCMNGCGAKETAEIPKLEIVHQHNEEKDEVIKYATCTEEGKKRIVYVCCGELKKDGNGNVIEIVIPKEDHEYELVKRVAPDCHSKGTEAHWVCKTCGKLFDYKDITKEIDKPAELDKTVHEFEEFNGHNKCKHCKEVVHIEKPNGVDVKVDINRHGGIKNEDDKAREEMANDISIESEIKIEKRDDVSNELHEKLPQDAGEEKIVLDITVEKIITNADSSKEREIITQTEDLVTIEIEIPQNMRGYKDFTVHRRHINEDQSEEVHILKVAPNDDGEHIEIYADKIIIHVKKFSEYAIVGYNEIVNIPEDNNGGYTGGSSSYTVKFNANGGTVVESINVARGKTITAPVTTREGYVFDGWYKDVALTEPFDFNTKITSNITLYAKWVVSAEGCTGTKEEGCPCFEFDDLNSAAWYHLGVDYAIDNGLMNGISDEAFAPDMNLTRAMLVTILWREEGKPEATLDVTYEDVAEGQYYTEAVEWATANGIVTGYSDTQFAPNGNILREQIAAIMFRYAKYKGYDVSVGENTNILSYADYSEVSEYAIPAMQYSVGSGLMKGRTDSTLNPRENATRAEVATILYRYFTSVK